MEFILNKIKEYNRIIIFGHVRPDGDCIGSQCGLQKILHDSFPEKEILVTGESSEYVGFLGKPTMIDDDKFEGALAICVDVANGDRVSDQRYKNCAYTIKIDHHINVDHFCDYEYVEEHTAACAEIITKFYTKFSNELKLSIFAAKCLYVGIVTDTGRFKFDAVNESTFNAASTLVKTGIDLGEIDNKLSVETMETLKLKGYCLNNFNVTENGFAYICMKRDIIEKYGVTDEEAANLVSTISTIEGSPAWAMFIEYKKNDQISIRIRLRSRGPVVNLLAEEYEGGGHAKASGANLKTWDDLNGFLMKADKLVKDYKDNNPEK